MAAGKVLHGPRLGESVHGYLMDLPRGRTVIGPAAGIETLGVDYHQKAEEKD